MLSIGISDPCVCSKNVQTIQIMTSAKILFVYLRYRLQNIPYFCVFKYARAVKQKVWNEAENRERDWGETLARVRLLRHALPISLLILRKKKPTVLKSTKGEEKRSWRKDDPSKRKMPEGGTTFIEFTCRKFGPCGAQVEKVREGIKIDE